MNRVFSFLGSGFFLLLFLCSSSFAQTDSTTSLDLDGKWGLSFHLYRDITLHPSDGKLISIRKMTDNTHAWRMGLSFSALNSEEESNISFNGSAIRQWYFDVDNSTRPYFGLGLQLGYYHEWLRNIQEIDLSVGPSVHIGIEWFVNNHISFSGEYGAVLLTEFTFRKNSSQLAWNSDKFYNDQNTFWLVVQEVRTGVAIYFW